MQCRGECHIANDVTTINGVCCVSFNSLGLRCSRYQFRGLRSRRMTVFSTAAVHFLLLRSSICRFHVLFRNLRGWAEH